MRQCFDGDWVRCSTYLFVVGFLVRVMPWCGGHSPDGESLHDGRRRGDSLVVSCLFVHFLLCVHLGLFCTGLISAVQFVFVHFVV